ncbi:hypothetical protein DRO61_11280 [Candidatus Bathyarchaeota archaeon]|nr:MAG: hypothetical protein DRO61_11280 [Candidatus Bathyarchaeota archaeon]
MDWIEFDNKETELFKEGAYYSVLDEDTGHTEMAMGICQNGVWEWGIEELNKVTHYLPKHINPEIISNPEKFN